MKQTILFDLDGTMLPMDLERFIKLYLQAFCQKFSQRVQLAPQLLVKAIWAGAGAMGSNDGSCLNREVFWRAMNQVCGKDMLVYESEFDAFYRNEFAAAREAVWVNPAVAQTVGLLREKGCRLIVATNPIFPAAAIHSRIRWAGLDPDDFDHITLYDNCTFAKPNPNYYREVCAACGVRPDDCLMVGNDVDEDMCAQTVGMDVYLVTDCLINRDSKPTEHYRQGSFEDFYRLAKESE